MSTTRQGMLCASGAFLLWGLLPVYWKALAAVPATEILAHRMVWSFVFLAGVVSAMRAWRVVTREGSQPAALALYGVAACLLAINWMTYIYGVNSDRIVETSLGYYINPLVSVLLGVVVLRERLRRVQWVAVGLAALGVGYLTWSYGEAPWIALVLAFSFGLYGLAKKRAPLGALEGLMVETAFLVIPAAVYLVTREVRGGGALGHSGASVTLLLVLSGAATSLPLLLFASGASKINLSTLGFLQYIAPTCALVIGVWGYGEAFTRHRAIGFGIIWAALFLYWLDGALRLRRTRLAVGH